MNNIISTYVQKLTKQDIINFALKNNLKISDQELDFVYNYIKNNYQSILNNPSSLDISKYKNEFSNENYLFITNLYNKYKNYLK